MTDALCIRDIDEEDVDALWQVILDPVFRAGDALYGLYRCIEVDIMGPEEVDGFIYPLSDLFVTIESGSGRRPPPADSAVGRVWILTLG